MIAWRQNAPSRAIMPAVPLREFLDEFEAHPDVAPHVEQAREVVATFIMARHAHPIKVAVAEHYGLPIGALVGDSRTYAVAHPRQLAMYLCRQRTSLSFARIARAFGRTDHTTVIHAVRSVEDRLAINAKIRADHDAIVEALGE